MGFDKAKTIRAAEKYLAQGKIPAAIQEYRQIVEQDPEDFTALNTLGDLYARIDKKREASELFSRVAEHYREQGFALKAIAMYKKVCRLNPQALDTAAQLAALYEQQGLIVEARTQYLTIADAYTRAGQAFEALDVLRRIADLDPRNVEIRLRLAESYQREEFPEEAAEAFNEAGAGLLARGTAERALEAYTKALSLRPGDAVALNGLLAAHSALGTADEAAEVLEKAVAEQPGDVELRALLARAYLEAENGAAAESATENLVRSAPSSYTVFFDVARLYLKQGEVEAAMRVISRSLEAALSGRAEATLVELLNEALARDPEQITALRLLVRIYTWQRDDERVRATLERLAETARANGLADEEQSALAQLASLMPPDEMESQFRPSLSFGEDTMSAAASAPHEQLSGPVGEEAPTFEGFSLIDEPFSAQAPATGAEEAGQFEWNMVEPPAASAPPPASRPETSFADLNEDFTSASSSFSAPHESASDAFSSSSESIDFGAPAQEGPGYSIGDAGDGRLAALLQPELESVDFYLGQGYLDIARDTLDMLERQYGTHPEIEARRARLQSAPGAPPGEEPAASHGAPEATEFALFSGDSSAPGDFSAAEAAPEIDAAFEDLASGVSPAGSAPPASTEGIDPGLAAIFAEFRTAVEEEEPPSGADYETHYNLGLAYKEMDLLDEAIEEFQLAITLIAPQDGTPRYLQCCNLLGHCFMGKGMPRPAALWFKKGLGAPGHTEDEYQALRYELGTAYEQMGDLDRAIETFSEVYAINVTYRGVSDKLRELQALRAAK